MSKSVEQKLAIGSSKNAIVIGGSITGLLAARVLLNYFDQVVIVERDRLPEKPESRQGISQANHVHLLLTRGLEIMEQLFPGLKTELAAAGAPTVDWIDDWFILNTWGLAPRFPSGLIGYTCSRNLLEWLLRHHLSLCERLHFLESCQVKDLLTDVSKAKVTGVQIYNRNEAARVTHSQSEELTADLVVDASGRNSSMPKWLESMGYQPPEETTINSFLGYASCWYQYPEGFQADWQGVTVMSKPPNNRRGGVLYPVENNRWIITLGGLGRDYPPTDQAGFLEFARSLRSPIIYEAIKEAKPLSPIYSYRRTENRLRHYEKLSKLPDGFVVLGDAVCAFNPIYGQGMTAAALSALTLDKCLHQQFRSFRSSLKGLTQRFQKQLAQVNSTPWLMATGEDFRWQTTEGGQPNALTRVKQQYIDQVRLFALDHPKVYQKYGEVLHMVKSPIELFKPGILVQVLGQAMGDIF